MDDDGFGGPAMDGGATVSLMHAAPSLMMAETHGVGMGLVASGYDDARGVSYGGGYGGVDARREYGGHASKLSSALHWRATGGGRICSAGSTRTPGLRTTG